MRASCLPLSLLSMLPPPCGGTRVGLVGLGFGGLVVVWGCLLGIELRVSLSLPLLALGSVQMSLCLLAVSFFCGGALSFLCWLVSPLVGFLLVRSVVVLVRSADVRVVQVVGGWCSSS